MFVYWLVEIHSENTAIIEEEEEIFLFQLYHQR